jgi:UDP-N-acetylglucosamine 2-epimerase (non-hydrolysing)
MILIAYGTRPEIIKLFPVINELKARRLPFKTLFTGQQGDLYEDVKDLVPKPDFSFSEYFFGENKHNTLGMSFVKICEASERLFNKHHFDLIIIQGDTTTAWALAQMAFYNGIKIAHVEAGLREKLSNKVLVTLHRRENHKIMGRLFDELQVVAEKTLNLN